jgi:hypothetical protein
MYIHPPVWLTGVVFPFAVFAYLAGGAPSEAENLARGCVQGAGASGVAEGVVRSVLVCAERFAFLGGLPGFIVPVGGELDFPSFTFDDLVRAISRQRQLVTLVAV